MNTQEKLRREAVLHALREVVDKTYTDAREDAQKALVADGAKVMEPSLPDGTKLGTTSLVTTKAKAAVQDAEEFAAWVARAYPGEVTRRVVTEVRPAFAQKLLAEILAAGVAVDPSTGEVVPGVVVTPARTSSHTVRLTDEGRAAIARAWNAGELADVVRLELPAGGES